MFYLSYLCCYLSLYFMICRRFIELIEIVYFDMQFRSLCEFDRNRIASFCLSK